MKQGHSQNIYHVSEDVSLMVENVTEDKIGTVASVNMSVKRK